MESVKYNNILEFIEIESPQLYEIIEELTLGRMFQIKNNIRGITYLHPDNDLLKKLVELYKKDEHEELINKLQSIILLDQVETLHDFDIRKNEIPNFLKKRLLVDKFKNNSVILTNGAIIKENAAYENYGNKNNYAVFTISGEFAPYSNEKIQVKKVDQTAQNNKKTNSVRANLFYTLLNFTHSSKNLGRDYFMEAVLSICLWAYKNNKELYYCLRDLCSYDTCVSYYIIFQPLRQSGYTYITDEIYNYWLKNYVDLKKMQFLQINNPSELYYKMIRHTSNEQKIKDIYELAIEKTEEINKATAIKLFKSIIEEIIEKKLINEKRMLAYKNINLAMAEAEIRVIFANCRNSRGYLSRDDILEWTKLNTLDDAYFCNIKKNMMSSSIQFCYSTIYLLLKSNAIVYVSGLQNNKLYTKSINDLNDDNFGIMIDGEFVIEDDAAEEKNTSKEKIRELNVEKFEY